MSNRVQLKTEMKDKDILSEALTSLGIKHEVCEEGAEIVDYWGKSTSDKAVVKVSKYVGFAPNSEGNLELVGDLHYERGVLRGTNGVQKVEQVYKAMRVYGALRQAGYAVEADFENCENKEEVVVTADVNLNA